MVKEAKSKNQTARGGEIGNSYNMPMEEKREKAQEEVKELEEVKKLTEKKFK